VVRTGSLPRRLLAAASIACVGLLAGVVATVASAGPASAAPADVSGSCAWDSESSQWVVTWTITNDAPAEVGSFRLASVEATPAESPVDGLAVAEPGQFPHDAGQPLEGEQRLPEAATGATLTVLVEWDDQQQHEQQGALEIPADCQVPSAPELLSEWDLSCDALTITVGNPGAEDAPLTFAPNAGEPVVVDVAGGGTATVEFPPSDGLTVDVLFEGQSIVDPADPIEITPERLAAQDCDEAAADDREGQGGGLAATGTPTILVVAGALVLLALGAGLYLIARRRRIRFTA
jgi:hypothetical protein